MHVSYLLHFFFIFLNIPFLPSSSESNPASSPYKNCAPQPYTCGDTTFNISYPFRIDSRPSYCGNPDYFINCTNMNTTLAITISNQQYKITNIDYNNNLVNIVNEDFVSDTGCPRAFTNTTINPLFFQYQRDRNLTLYINCSVPPIIQAIANNACPDFGGQSYYRLDNGTLDDSAIKCSSIINVPLGQETANNLINGGLQFKQAMQRGFYLQWTASSDWCGTCMTSGGYCGFNSTDVDQHLCFCSAGTSTNSCDTQDSGHPTTIKIIMIIIGVTLGLALLSILGCYIFIPSFHGPSRISEIFYKKAKHAHTIEAFLANFGSLATKRYAYSDIKRMTKSFSDRIGQGGYGSVYKGKLFNGHPVAVKILNETKGNGEDFINEVAAIGRTSHVNVVGLLGFCVEGSKRALIYDFMSNGSLDKYIYLDKDTNQRTLGWEKLYNITIGIARGLEYLHRGCNTRIVHLTSSHIIYCWIKIFVPKFQTLEWQNCVLLNRVSYQYMELEEQ